MENSSSEIKLAHFLAETYGINKLSKFSESSKCLNLFSQKDPYGIE